MTLRILPKGLLIAASVVMLGGCQSLPAGFLTPAPHPAEAAAPAVHPAPAAPAVTSTVTSAVNAPVTSVTPGTSATLPSQAEREALIQKALTTYSTIPSDPILRIDTNAHIRTIHALELSRQGNLLATASIDRTVRLWETASGRLIDTLRVPMGQLGLGTTYALTFSPDEKMLVTGGLSFFPRKPATLRQATFTVYFFDIAQRGIVRTLDDVPGRIHHLAYSANGKQLVVAYGAESLPDLGIERVAGSSGVRIYDAQSLTVLREVATDSPCEWAEFDLAQRLFVSCRNTFLSIDDQGSLRIREAPRDAQFYRAAIAPDGRNLAVSYFDRARIDILSTEDLSLRYGVDFADAATPANAHVYGDLQPIWSPGGMYLYAGGRRLQAEVKENHLFKWDQGGRGKAQAFPVGRMDILAMHAHKDGRMFYAASNGSVGALDARDRLEVLIEHRTVSSDNRPGALWVSPDGRTVAYSDDDDGKQRFVFSHEKRTLTPWHEYKDRDALLAPNIQGNPRVTRWQISRQVQCNDTMLDLGETVAQNMAMLRNGKGFAIGTDSGVIFYDQNCRRIWENRTQGRTLAINIAEEGGFVVAQDEAGVIRWLRVSDGFKVLSIFASRHGKSWAAWTTEGYYDASPEGEKLVGWHLNQNRQRAANFYNAGRFRNLYHNADEITAALLRPASSDTALTADQQAARQVEIRRQMQATLPPQVTILAIREMLDGGIPVARVDYKLRTPSGEPVQRVRALVNGRPSGAVQEFPDKGTGKGPVRQTGKGSAPAEEIVHSLKVPLPPGEAEIALIAESQGAVGEPDFARLQERLAAPAVATAGSGQVKPKLYALVIGVGAYRHEKISALDFPAKDARDFANALKSQRGKLYRDVEVRLLEDAAATREAVIDGLDWLRKQVTANDLAVLFMAGHGVNDSANRYYFVPVNADPTRLRSTAVANSDISEVLQALPSKVLGFLDTCHAGNVLGSSKQRNIAVGMTGDINRLVNELTSAENGVVVFASSTGRETSQESPDWKNGAFTKALVEGLGGKADFSRDGVISLNELNLYVAERVKNLTDGEQHANMIRPDSVRDFPFALMK